MPSDLETDLRLLLTIRHFEELLLRLFGEGKLNGTTHTCLGQEHVPVALKPLLGPGDFILSNHRGHGHYLARFEDPAGLLAELMGREGAVCAGVGGSQHILRDRSYLSTGVQGESLAIGVGLALQRARARSGALALAFIGDGTWGEGAVYEALNLAALWKVPLVVAVEHNGIAQSTPTSIQMSGTIAARAAAFGIPHLRLSEVDLEALRAQLAPALARVREGSGPLVLEFEVPRLGPHSKGDDTRNPEELERLRQRDWMHHYRARFPGMIEPISAEVRASLARLAAEIEARPLSRWEQR